MLSEARVKYILLLEFALAQDLNQPLHIKSVVDI